MKVVKPHDAVRSYAPAAAAWISRHTETAAASQSTPGRKQKACERGGDGMPAGYSQFTVTGNRADGSSAWRSCWHRSRSYTGEPGVEHRSTSPTDYPSART